MKPPGPAMADIKMPPLLGRRFDVDFARARPAVTPLAWAMLALGGLLLAAAVADFVPHWQRHERLQREQQALRERLERMPGAPRAAAAHSAADTLGQLQARGLLDQLDRPWAALFDRLEAIQAPDVHVVQFGVDPGFHAVQMIAEASTLEHVLQYSQQLAAQAPVRAVRLTRHEWRAAPVGRIVVANLTAELAAPGPKAAP